MFRPRVCVRLSRGADSRNCTVAVYSVCCVISQDGRGAVLYSLKEERRRRRRRERGGASGWLFLALLLGIIGGGSVMILGRNAPTSSQANELPTLIASTDVAVLIASPVLGATLPPPSPTVTATTGPDPDKRYVVYNGLYIVQQDDTVTEIAAGLGVPVEGLMTANPGLDPRFLTAGQAIIVPDRAAAATATAIGVLAVVRDGGEARVWLDASVDAPILTLLPPGTAVATLGRSQDAAWLEILTPSGGRGWVAADSMRPSNNYDILPVTTGAAAEPFEDVESVELPLYLSNITPRARQIVLVGLSMGNRADVFSKVGDSITDNPHFLVPFGTDDHDLGQYQQFADVIDFYSSTSARTGNSFTNTSLAAKGGWSTWNATDPGSADPDYCLPGESPLACEYRLVRPSVALIMLGTNDVPTASTKNYEDWMRRVIEASIERGVLPVLSTIPPFYYGDFVGVVEAFNGILENLSQEYQIPLWDYWGALQPLPAQGMSYDGIHPSWANPGDLSEPQLRYGMNMRNLTALQVLDTIWQDVVP